MYLIVDTHLIVLNILKHLHNSKLIIESTPAPLSAAQKKSMQSIKTTTFDQIVATLLLRKDK